MSRRRIDLLLLEKGLASSRAQAQELVRAGLVRVEGAIAAKPAAAFPEGSRIEILGAVHPFVSRGGVKLDHALAFFGLDVAGLVCLDVGASTGGFTDVLLRRDAARVYATDVGHGQLHESLKRDPRVISIEGLNAKDITSAAVLDAPGVVVADLSFISLTKALPPALALAEKDALLVALIKPQFEAGRENIGKGGLVKDAEVQARVCRDIADWLEKDMNWRVLGLTPSPIAGGDGNAEFLIAARKR